jgi:hypothetical protein
MRVTVPGADEQTCNERCPDAAAESENETPSLARFHPRIVTDRDLNGIRE